MRYAPIRLAAALIREVGQDDVTGMSAEMAYRFLFATFPLLLLSIALIGLIGAVLGRHDLVRSIVHGASTYLPQSIAASTDGIAAALVSQARAYAVFGLAAALWGASGGIGALIKGLNRAYDVTRPRSTLRQQATEIVATLLIPPLGLVLLLVSLLGQSVMTWFGSIVGLSGPLAGAVTVTQAIATSVVFFFGIAVVYRALPAVDQTWRQVVPGAALSAVAWLVMTQAFGVYIANINGYRATYGAFAAAISFLLWLYLVSMVVLLGAEINALLLPTQRPGWAAGEADGERPSDVRR